MTKDQLLFAPLIGGSLLVFLWQDQKRRADCLAHAFGIAQGFYPGNRLSSDCTGVVRREFGFD